MATCAVWRGVGVVGGTLVDLWFVVVFSSCSCIHFRGENRVKGEDRANAAKYKQTTDPSMPLLRGVGTSNTFRARLFSVLPVAAWVCKRHIGGGSLVCFAQRTNMVGVPHRSTLRGHGE